MINQSQRLLLCLRDIQDGLDNHNGAEVGDRWDDVKSKFLFKSDNDEPVQSQSSIFLL